MKYKIVFQLDQFKISDPKRKDSEQFGTYTEIVDAICREVRLLMANAPYSSTEKTWYLTLKLEPEKEPKKND